jgi:APA family basic amino acid/polyamine antiporter
VPLGGITIGGLWLGWVPMAGMVLCLCMAAPVAIDIASQATRGQVLPLLIIGGYALLGVWAYFAYAIRHSTLRRGAAVLQDVVAPG